MTDLEIAEKYRLFDPNALEALAAARADQHSETVRRIRAYRAASSCNACNEFLLDLEKNLELHKPRLR